MNLHANAALSLNKRRQLCERVVEQAWTLTKAAEAAEVSVRCARKWVGRYRAEGKLGLLDRSSAPSSIPHRTGEDRVQAIAALRRAKASVWRAGAEMLGGRPEQAPDGRGVRRPLSRDCDSGPHVAK